MADARMSYPEQRLKLARMIKALGADPLALVRGADLNWAVEGEHGDIRPLPQGWEVFLACESPAAWKAAKVKLGFFVVKENGVSGLFWLEALPDRDQAAAIVDLLGIKLAWRGPSPKARAHIGGYSAVARMMR